MKKFVKKKSMTDYRLKKIEIYGCFLWNFPKKLEYSYYAIVQKNRAKNGSIVHFKQKV